LTIAENEWKISVVQATFRCTAAWQQQHTGFDIAVTAAAVDTSLVSVMKRLESRLGLLCAAATAMKG
jgi:hypothetical protein